MEIKRRKSKVIKIGNVYIGGNNPIAIQSMVKTKTADVEKAIRQIKELKKTGCEIVRLAVRDSADARALKKIKPKVKLPLVADIHFDWRLALEAIDSGVDKIRLNPGNIYKKDQLREIVKAAKLAGIPIRIGVNSGSLRNHQPSVGFRLHSRRATNRRLLADKMVKNALDYIRILERFKFYDLVISLKSSHIFDTIEAYRRMAKHCDYPFHLGVTAAGSLSSGAIKSSIAIGVLLLEGIGDTIRVSLTDKPEAEVKLARRILDSLGLRHFGPQIISCPTCGRCEVNLVKLVKDFEEKLAVISRKTAVVDTRPLKVALMGCVVNGPGEAKEADIGVAFGKDEGLLFKRGTPIKKISVNICIDKLLKEMEKKNE